MRSVLLVLIAASLATPMFAQEPRPASPPTETLASQPAEARPAGLSISPAALREVVGGQTPIQQEWQRQYDAAKARRRSGQRKFFIGLGMGFGGMAMMMAGVANCAKSSGACHTNQSRETIGFLLLLGSEVPFWWGIIDWAGGAGAVHSLEATRPVAGTSQTVTLTEHQALQISLGSRTSVGYRLAW